MQSDGLFTVLASGLSLRLTAAAGVSHRKAERAAAVPDPEVVT